MGTSMHVHTRELDELAHTWSHSQSADTAVFLILRMVSIVQQLFSVTLLYALCAPQQTRPPQSLPDPPQQQTTTNASMQK